MAENDLSLDEAEDKILALDPEFVRRREEAREEYRAGLTVPLEDLSDVRHGVEGEDNSYELDEFIAEVRAEHAGGR